VGSSKNLPHIHNNHSNIKFTEEDKEPILSLQLFSLYYFERKVGLGKTSEKKG
jgi:hypothetical protein